VLHADEARGPLDDLVEQLPGLEPLQELERRLVDRGEVQVPGRVIARPA
jgi:hypothetical protein